MKAGVGLCYTPQTMPIHGTTILAVYDPDQRRAILACDGQATLNDQVIKHSAQKVRPLHDGQVLAGFAGATADSLTLFERFEGKLSEYGGNLKRSAVELAKEWRTDRMLRRLEALMAVVSSEGLLLLSGAGDVIEPDDGLIGVGSGGMTALAAARALRRQNPDMPIREVVQTAMGIASEIDVYTNDRITMEELEW